MSSPRSTRQAAPGACRDRCSVTQRLHLHRRLRTQLFRHEVDLFHLGIDREHSRPYHPQTGGKVGAFPSDAEEIPARQPRAATIEELQR